MFVSFHGAIYLCHLSEKRKERKKAQKEIATRSQAAWIPQVDRYM